MPKISWPPKQLLLTTSGNWDHWCVWQVHCPFFEWSYEKLVDVFGDPKECQWLHQRLYLTVVRGNAASILACVRVWSNFTCSFSSSCFKRTDHHHCLPLAPVSMCSYCLPNPRSFCKIHFPSVVQCYLVHWLNILSITWPMMRVQHGFVFNIAWNLWGRICAVLSHSRSLLTF